ncbi:hypothetical protein [Brevibacillus brevis]|uniref:MmyB family transcriptional regulator n=1 Tax=Brevibacillus brevis TaxID=1393 RepID=UPI002ED2FD60
MGTKQINHPTAGTMTMEHMTFRVYDAPELKLTIYRPLKENDSIKKLNLLMNGG